MNTRKAIISVYFLLTFCSISFSQSKNTPRLIGTCEGCEAIFEYGNKKLSAVDYLPDYIDKGPKLKITGIIYKSDGKTPAKDIILYIYHTNQEGIYPTKPESKGWERRHGYIRGWAKTGEDGRYTFYTLKPAHYPAKNPPPMHIHPTILEPDGKYYWIETFYFEGDPNLLERQKNPTAPRGGSSGVLHLRKEGDLLVAEHDIILGNNVPDYN